MKQKNEVVKQVAESAKCSASTQVSSQEKTTQTLLQLNHKYFQGSYICISPTFTRNSFLTWPVLQQSWK